MSEPQVTQTHRVFSILCSVEANIRARAEIVWGLLPLAKGSMPDFGPVLDRCASDLKREAERGLPPS